MKSAGTWYGRPIEELSKSELIEALIELNKLYITTRERQSLERQILVSDGNKNNRQHRNRTASQPAKG